jgi:hypothetical protein
MADLGVDLKMIANMDPYIFSGYVIAVVATIACLVYAWIKRDKGED